MPTASSSEERRFRAVDVLTGAIDKKPPVRRRKQISAYLTPEQVRTLGALHAQLASAGEGRIEKSEIVGLAIELLAATIATAEHEGVPLPDLAAVRGYVMRQSSRTG